MSRAALALSLLAVAVSAAALVLLGEKVATLSRRVAAIESRPSPAAPPKPAPAPPAPEAAPNDEDRKKLRELAERENQSQFAALAKKLEPGADLEAGLRDAFAAEFAYYVDGVVRALEELKRGDDTGDGWMSSPQFRKGLEERIAETDDKVKSLLTVAQFWKYEEWRKAMRKERYELD